MDSDRHVQSQSTYPLTWSDDSSEESRLDDGDVGAVRLFEDRDDDGDDDPAIPPPSPSLSLTSNSSKRVTSPSPQHQRDHTFRVALARRLERLAESILSEDEVDENLLRGKVDQLEHVLGLSTAAGLARSTESHMSEDEPRGDNQDNKTPSAQGNHHTPEKVSEIIQEADQLNEELTRVLENLQARQEESDHIHALLIDRAERAAQHIILLQSRIAYLESELNETDDELHHLRICLKAVEIQLPPHPDRELLRCLRAFKEDYLALKRKRRERMKLRRATDTTADVEMTPPADTTAAAAAARNTEGRDARWDRRLETASAASTYVDGDHHVVHGQQGSRFESYLDREEEEEEAAEGDSYESTTVDTNAS